MSRKRKVKQDDPSVSWEIKTELQVNGRLVQKGTELKIQGERGRFRFIQYVKTPTSDWIDVWGGTNNHEQMRSFKLERIKTVHYKNKTTKHLAESYKEKKRAIKNESPQKP